MGHCLVLPHLHLGYATAYLRIRACTIIKVSGKPSRQTRIKIFGAHSLCKLSAPQFSIFITHILYLVPFQKKKISV